MDETIKEPSVRRDRTIIGIVNLQMDVDPERSNEASAGGGGVGGGVGEAVYVNLELIEGKDGRAMRDLHPLKNGCEDAWSWNRRDRSAEALLSGPGNRTVHFHPNWSKGTAGIRGTRTLNNGRYYWELKLSDRIFGTR